MSKAPDVPVIGGGPAGMSCALWLANYGLHPVIIEQAPALGGMARESPYPNDWLLGRPGQTPRENAAAFADHIRQVGIECWLGAAPQRLRQRDGGFEVDVAFADGRAARTLAVPAIVIATGTRFRGNDWVERTPGARQVAAAGRLDLGPTHVGEPSSAIGSQIAIIGGGDNAFDVARTLAEKGVRVTVVMRSEVPHARPGLVDALRSLETDGRAKVMAGRTVAALELDGAGVRLRLDDGSGIDTDRVVLLFGYQPDTDASWLAALSLDKDADGYLIVDRKMETSYRGVFAVGDVADPAQPAIAVAVASGTVAAREIQRRLSSR
jgi:thioredoxin reductase